MSQAARKIGRNYGTLISSEKSFHELLGDIPDLNESLGEELANTSITQQDLIGIRMDPKKVTKIVMVCGILHNICIQLNEPDVAAEELVNEDVENGNNYNGQQDGRGIRQHIAETYFNRH
ncbi:Hypothetical predicted protein [Mytilus galloprovincialis]|uniref:DDE Tnp4 domain-containing protein n=1 Tax=Mytilus galloprovincialis TaxID=29158 RepID=A0A8B6E4G7_MYTGA|nr:Hypothetical predicted protein [Mytilus galloprovincialis]